ncbi:MAG: L,D-transpeptidase family protein [Clostridiales bacterium]|nr:L,D-transpeptidase family protein [Clostridiales bacterium]
MANYYDLEDFKKKKNNLPTGNDDKTKTNKIDVEDIITATNKSNVSKMSKQDMASLIAQNLSNYDDDEETTSIPVRKNRSYDDGSYDDSMTYVENSEPRRNSVAVNSRTSTGKRPNRGAVTKNVTQQNNEYEDNQDPRRNESKSVRPRPNARDDDMRKPPNNPRNNKYKSRKSKSKKPASAKTTLAIIGGFIVVAFIAFYVGGRFVVSDKFLPNTKINGNDVGMMTVAQATESLQKTGLNDYLLIVKNNGSTERIKFEDFDYNFKIDDKVEELYENQKKGAWFKSLFSHQILKIDTSKVQYDETKFKELVKEIEWGDTKPIDAYISASDSGFVIEPEKLGDLLDTEKLATYLVKELNKGNIEIDIIDSGAYIQPAVTAKDLESQIGKYEAIGNIEITIDFDYTTEVLRGQDFINWIIFNDDGTYTVDDEKLGGYVSQLADKYDTFGKARKFHATLQGDITVPHGKDAIYGWEIYKEKTVELLKELIIEGKSVTTDPIYYYQLNADGSKGYTFVGNEEVRTENDDIGDTYIEIDLTAQTLWYYEKGEKKYECTIVSGTMTAGQKTNPGIYKLWYREMNYTMKGTNSEAGSWTVKCTYWNRVALVGIGLHDSKRPAFGGNIYKQNGSQGCINMRYNDVKFIHESVPLNTPVVMYY